MKAVKFVPKNQVLEADDGSKSESSQEPKTPRGTARRLPAKLAMPNQPNRLLLHKRGRSFGKMKFEPPKPEIAKDFVKIVEVHPEPTYDVIPGKYKDFKVRVSAVADFVSFNISATELSFAPTMMYETRTIEVSLSNTSQIRFEYTWILTKISSMQFGEERYQVCPFSISPKSGYIESGNTTVFRVQFNPQEVDDYAASFLCEIPFLAEIEPPQVQVTGISRRPLCYLDAEMSDYISAGRRHPDYTYPVPDDIRVIELFSTGIGQRSLKQFQIINPTGNPYEIMWTNDPEHRNNAITCDYPRSLISGGKRSRAMFSYLPSSVKTVESVWTFTIPEHSVAIKFLVVGRIMPH
jgi:hydrocephalus-inducing protein